MVPTRNVSILVILFAVAVTSAVGVLLGLNMTEGSSADTQTAQSGAAVAGLVGKAQGTSIEPYHFDSLDAMAATSSVIIHGTVRKVSAGRGYGTDHDQMGWSNAEVATDETLAGGAGRTVVIEQLTSQAGTPVVLNGLAPLKVGDTGFFFLRRGQGDTHVLISSQGQYLEDAGRLYGRTGSDAAVSHAEQLSPDGLRAEVSRARRALAQGNVQAQRPAFGTG